MITFYYCRLPFSIPSAGLVQTFAKWLPYLHALLRAGSFGSFCCRFHYRWVLNLHAEQPLLPLTATPSGSLTPTCYYARYSARDAPALPADYQQRTIPALVRSSAVLLEPAALPIGSATTVAPGACRLRLNRLPRGTERSGAPRKRKDENAVKRCSGTPVAGLMSSGM